MVRRRAVACTLMVLALLTLPALAASPPPSEAGSKAVDIDIPFQKFVLNNGLTLIVHEDHKAPIVAVNIWYHVGSKNEKPGRTGFAHIFEHLMFNGSENFNDDYFKVLERIGATDLNGTTNEDRTNYFQNVPTSALDTVLWMESDRMGHLLGAVGQAKLDEQRGVVQNEKRQGENEPYSLSEELIAKTCFPAGHPYSWTVIGSMEDLSAAKLEDVHEWFKTYYGAANAVIVVAGDVDVKTAKEKVEKFFGDIPAGPPIARPAAWIAKRSGEQRAVAQDRVPQARIYKIWNVPPRTAPDADYLTLAASVLATGKTSRLYKRLVYDDQIATDVEVVLDDREIAGLFDIVATAKPGGDLSKVEKAIDEELARFLRDGPTAEELSRAKTEYVAGFVRGIERIGGFGGKSDILASGQVFAGRPDFYKSSLARIEGATAQDVKNTSARWLSDGVYVLEIHPFPEFVAATTKADRAKLPEPGAPPTAAFPEMKKGKLSNGLQVIVAERHAVPLVGFDLILDAGYASDQSTSPGTASLAMSMLDEGTKSRSALQISDELARLGATLGAGSALDSSFVTMSALKTNLDASLELMADVVLNPSFPDADFQRLQKQQLARIQAEKAEPFGMALRVFPKVVYGAGHAYGTPFTGSGYEQTVAALTRDALVRFHEAWFKPNRATLVVVGDTTLAEIQPKLEALFKGWKPGEIPAKNLATVAHRPRQTVYVVDRPGSIQSILIAGHVAPPKANPDEIAIETLNYVLGGAFVSRINMNLREDKHWTYGAGSFIPSARGQRPFVVFTSVQTDKTKEAMAEIEKELRGPSGQRPVTADELAVAKAALTLQLPGSWETGNAVAESIGELVRFGLPDDYYATYPGKVKALALDDVAGAARKVLRPDGLIWVVVGDRSKIEGPLRELGLGDIQFIDADGNPL